MIGITADYPITKAFSVAAELIYNGRGAGYRVKNNSVILFDNKGSSQQAYNYYNFKLDYIELPILAQYDFSQSAFNGSYIIYGGIAPAFVANKGVSSTYYTSGGSSPVDVTTASKDGDLDNVNGFNINPIIGFRLGGNRSKLNQFFGDFRFEYSFLPVFNRSSINGTNLETNMWTAGLGIGIRF